MLPETKNILTLEKYSDIGKEANRGQSQLLMDILEMLSGKHNIAANIVITIIINAIVIITMLMINWLTLWKCCLIYYSYSLHVINQFMLALIVIINHLRIKAEGDQT